MKWAKKFVLHLLQMAAQNSSILFKNRPYTKVKGHTPCLKGFIYRK